MKKSISLNPAAVKRYFSAAVKKSSVYIYQAGSVSYMSDGRVIVVARGDDEYTAYIRPIVGRDPGTYTLKDGTISDGSVDLAAALAKTASDPVAATDTAAVVDGARLFWLASMSRPLSVDEAFLSLIKSGADMLYMSAGYAHGLCVYDGRDVLPCLFIMDKRPSAAAEKVAAALYSADTPKAPVSVLDACAEIERLQAELAAAKARLASAETVASEALKRERAALASAAEKPTRKRFTINRQRHPSDPLPTPSMGGHLRGPSESPKKSAENPSETADKSDALRALLALLETTPGLACEVRGAKTSAPVMWVSGDTKPYKEQLKAAGFRWSPKRSAWWVKKPA